MAYSSDPKPIATRLIVPFERENFLAYYGDYRHLPDDERHLIDQALTYFENCKIKTVPITTAGLAVALSLTRRDLFAEAEKEGQRGEIIRKAVTICEKFAEQQLYTGSANGAAFALKNMGWTDKKETEISGELDLKMGDLLKAIRSSQKPAIREAETL